MSGSKGHPKAETKGYPKVETKWRMIMQSHLSLLLPGHILHFPLPFPWLVSGSKGQPKAEAIKWNTQRRELVDRNKQPPELMMPKFSSIYEIAGFGALGCMYLPSGNSLS
jgi:hypothetical protein